LLIFIIALFAIAGCKSAAVINPFTTDNCYAESHKPGTLPRASKSAVEVTVNLPSGVTVRATSDNGVLVMDPGVVVASGVIAGMNITNSSVYTAATATEPGKVNVNLLKSDGTGFGTGEFVTVSAMLHQAPFRLQLIST
jgi:hypothetical protein